MPHYAPQATLLRVGQASKTELSWWSEGVHLEASTGRRLHDLRERAASDRIELANSFRKQADRMMKSQPGLYRDAVSRFYYSMYHAMRAVVYYAESGDDYEAHSKLPGKTPHDFPNHAFWQNALKDARERRNAADYDPYPKSDAAHKKIASGLQANARALIVESRTYLRSKGCSQV